VSDLRDVIGDDPRSVASYTAQRQINVQLRNMILSRGQTVVWSQEQLPRVYERVVGQLSVAMTGARAFGLPELLDEAIDDARHFLATRVQHLGPLRMDPQVVYQSSPVANPGFIGAKGEYSASVLQASGRERLHEVPMPPGSEGPRLPTLLDAVNQWAAFLGIGEEFHTTDQGKIGLQMSVRQPGVDMDLDLTSVGTGVSQLLPVLVMCLQAPPGSLLLIEQPELHLNPAVQQRLADFLLAIARSGRQLLIETHSDFLVTRLRLRTAEDQSGQVQDQIALVFAERRDGATTYEVVKPALDGSIADWPRGFFDEAARDSFELLRAVLDKND
jgi:predicted ATPase